MNAAADTVKDVRANVLDESAIEDLLLYNNVNRHVYFVHECSLHAQFVIGRVDRLCPVERGGDGCH